MGKPVIALLGTGLMGQPMARNLLSAGYPLRVWNRTASKAAPLAEFGAEACDTAAGAVSDADAVISMLSDGSASARVQRDPDLRAVLRPGMTWIEMGSIQPDEARTQAADLATLGVAHLDAPVSGGTRGAEAASLAIMVGGDPETFEQVKPILETMGRPVRVGPSGTGQLSKLANQAIVAVTIGAVAEAMLLVEQGGADPAAVRQALKGGFADSTILQQHGERMTTGNFIPGGLSKFQLKDLDNLLNEAAQLGLTLPLSENVRRRFAYFCAELDGADKDHSGLYLELRAQNGLKGDPA